MTDETKDTKIRRGQACGNCIANGVHSQHYACRLPETCTETPEGLRADVIAKRIQALKAKEAAG